MIVCAGEALIDMLPRTLPSGESVFLPVPGGAALNSATAVGRLGEPVALLAGLSRDMFGARLRDAMQAALISDELLVESDAPSTLAFVQLVNGHARYAFFDENSAMRTLEIADLPALPEAVEALLLGGISLNPEPCGSAYEALAGIAAKAGTVVHLDPNIRPAFVVDAAEHRARIARMARHATIVKVSDEDLAWLANDGDGQALVDGWIADGTALVVVTKGGEGVDVQTARERWHMSVQPVEVVDTVGAGDTFNAALLVGLRRAGLLDRAALAAAGRDALAPALDLAARAAARVVARQGADPPWQHELGEVAG